MTRKKRVLDRREFLKESAIAAAAIGVGLGEKPIFARVRKERTPARKLIIIGIDGMDYALSKRMIAEGKLPTFARLHAGGGFKPLGTSIPPQSPVAWANFINGAGPGSHGIFDFIHRHPEKQCLPFFSVSETIPGKGYWNIGDHKLQMNFWPFDHDPPATVLRRQGVPFWDYLDRAGIASVFYDLPSNYPPSASKHDHHKCLSGLGTPDVLGTYGTYQHYAENGPSDPKEEGGGRHSMLTFENETAHARIVGPRNSFLKEPQRIVVEFSIHRDSKAKAALIDIQGQRILLKEGQWSRWIRLNFEMSLPALMPSHDVSAICRFYLQEVSPNFRLYVSPLNSDPSDSVLRLTEPPEFIEEISSELGLFYTTGFQEAYNALSNKVFTDKEYLHQAEMVLQERLRLMDYAFEHYEDGLLFFYFSSTDLQSHMFWWDSNEKHPVRSDEGAKQYFNKIKELYQRMDDIVGDILKRYGDEATVIVMSDHGFANFKRQFNLNTWLKKNGYIEPADSTSILSDVDWRKTRAYGLGINGLYLNMRGRELNGIVSPSKERRKLLEELAAKLEQVRDIDGRPVIRKAHITEDEYSGDALKLAPDIVVGYHRDYRASWATCLGSMTDEVLLDNDSAWSADHCADVMELPGVVFSNRPIKRAAPSLVDIAPSVLSQFGLELPPSMEGKNIFSG